MAVEPRGIEDLKSMLSKGISRPTLYQVIVTYPRAIAGLTQSANDQLEFLCTKTAVPPASVNTIAVPGHEAMGVTREQPTMVTFNSPFTITVMSDRDYTVYKSIKRWLDQVAENANPNLFGGFNGQSQRMGYYEDFATTIELKKLELQGGRGTREPGSYSEPFTINFTNAFPVRIGEITLGADMTDTAVEFTVDFAYETYTFETGQGRTVNGLV